MVGGYLTDSTGFGTKVEKKKKKNPNGSKDVDPAVATPPVAVTVETK